MSFIPVIISGGSGSRLWPLSRDAHPKPFIELPDGSTLIGKTYNRAARLDGVDHILTVTNRDFLFLTLDAYADAKAPATDNVFLLEPLGRDTAPAVAAAALQAAAAYGSDTVLLVMPADHLIADEAAFADAVTRARRLAETGRIVTFGIVPDRAETGFGYIEADGENALRFVEKPDAATAQAYDDEMRERIAGHRVRRPDGWQTVDAPLELAEALAAFMTVLDGYTLKDLLTARADIGELFAARERALAACPG